jgi:hypothetical protein
MREKSSHDLRRLTCEVRQLRSQSVTKQDLIAAEARIIRAIKKASPKDSPHFEFSIGPVTLKPNQ